MRHAAIATSFVSLVTAGLLAGCPDRSISEVDPQQGRVEAKDIPVNVNRDVDILFVIDDSPSMADKQANLAFNFPKFIEVLSTIQGGLPNVHIAVVTSDMGSKGAEDPVPAQGIGSIGNGGCAGVGKGGSMQLFGAPVAGGQYINDVRLEPAGTRQINYTGSLNDAFAKMAKAGAGGCGFEQHLEAMKAALRQDTPNPVNTGFLRPDAFLAVVFIADEDDCSMAHTSMLAPENSTLGPQQSFRCTRFGIVCDDGGTTSNAMNVPGIKTKCHPNDASPYLTKVNDYVTFLKDLKTDAKGVKHPEKVIVAGIMGKPDSFEVELRPPPKSTTKIPALAHSCTYVVSPTDTEVADPPIRLKYFLDQFPNRSTFAPICQQDLSGGLQQIGDLLKTVIGDPCIEGKLADVDQKTEGKQYDCSVSSVLDPGTAAQVETIMPRCTPENDTATNKPCWHLVSDPAACPCSVKEDPPGVCATNTEHYTLKIEGKDTLAKDTHVIANCVTEVTNN
jgi:hypothetical protein